MYGRASAMTESVTTSIDSSATSQAGGAGGAGDRMQRPGVEGRGGKANRRRSRASRKAPTTVLNTDTANFRAMVQQYTGGPSTAVPFQAAAYPFMAGDGVGGSGPGATLGYGLAAGNSTAGQQLQHQPGAAFPAALGVQQQYQQYYGQFQQHHERPLFMPAGPSGGGRGDVYLRGFGSSSLQRDIADAPDVFLLERFSSSQVMPRPAASTAGDSASDGFFL